MFMGFKRTGILALAVIMLMCSGCNSEKPRETNPTVDEYEELREITMIGKHNLQDIKDDFRKFLLVLYNPPSAKVLEDCFEILEPYSTERLIENLRYDTNSYKSGVQQEIKIETITFGSKNYSLDNTNKLLCEIYVDNATTDVRTRTFIEFSLNDDNEFFKYDVWVYYE